MTENSTVLDDYYLNTTVTEKNDDVTHLAMSFLMYKVGKLLLNFSNLFLALDLSWCSLWNNILGTYGNWVLNKLKYIREKNTF